VTTQQVQATERMMQFADDPEPPPNLSDEEWSRMLVEVGLFGSPGVSEALEDFRSKVLRFSGHLMTACARHESRRRRADAAEGEESGARGPG
jgi:hypothetical protein